MTSSWLLPGLFPLAFPWFFPCFFPWFADPLFVERPEAFLAHPVDPETGQQSPELLPTPVITTCGGPEKRFILEVNGGGVALGDFDADGWIDVLLVDGSTIERVREDLPGLPPRLFLNCGEERPGTFAPAGGAWEIAPGRWGMGCATGDLNGDGWLDVVITEWGADRVLLNVDGQGFREITDGAGLSGKRWGTSAALCDFDGDSVLDLVVANYLAFYLDELAEKGPAKWKGHDVMRGPEGLGPVHDQIYKGRGDGTFVELDARAVGFEPLEAGYSLGVMPLDFDRDGDVDLYVANDSTANYLYENRGDGTFEFVPVGKSQVAYDENGKEQAGMGIAAGDVNGDGKTDLLVTNFSGESNTLYVSRKRFFGDQTTLFGVRGPSLTKLGWGTGFGDFDLDGDLDAFVLNGHVYPQADEPGTDTSYAQEDQLYRRVADKRFEVEHLTKIGATVSRAGAAADLDNDGDLDLVCWQMNAPLRVLENTTLSRAAQAGSHHWLRVGLRGAAANTSGIGAIVTAEWEGGSQTAELFTAAGFQAAKPPEVHFGLGAIDTLERLTVIWPGGGETVLEDVAVDRVLRIVEEER